MIPESYDWHSSAAFFHNDEELIAYLEDLEGSIGMSFTVEHMFSMHKVLSSIPNMLTKKVILKKWWTVTAWAKI